VYDQLPKAEAYLFPAGRLDLDTSGLLVMTNDSAFAERLTNPESKVEKTYLVKASRSLSDDDPRAFGDGGSRFRTVRRGRRGSSAFARAADERSSRS
jgi:pseudouridine synthase